MFLIIRKNPSSSWERQDSSKAMKLGNKAKGINSLISASVPKTLSSQKRIVVGNGETHIYGSYIGAENAKKAPDQSSANLANATEIDVVFHSKWKAKWQGQKRNEECSSKACYTIVHYQASLLNGNLRKLLVELTKMKYIKQEVDPQYKYFHQGFTAGNCTNNL